jgi:cytochrome c biogenesis protein CcdA/thiol-disulfide isomerase/thioredoxin
MNALDIALAFLEGLALIISPCILPVLPLVLAGSTEGGKQRPYGIIIGFVLAFSLFAIVARKLVALLGLDLDVIKDASLVLLALFGLVLLSSWLSDKFGALTQGLADLGNRIAGTGGAGMGSGIVIGALIGLVWTPCAGPILAAVLVQVIRQQTDLSGDLVIVAFALGAGVPMLAIALAGRKIMGKLGFFARHAEAVRRGFGVLILASVAFIASGLDVRLASGTLISATSPAAPASHASQASRGMELEEGIAFPYDAPPFAASDTWLNSPPLTMKELRGKVVLVDFWTYSCINCVRTLPYITDWYRKYHAMGLVIVGVHSPEFEFEKNPDNVKAAIAQYGIQYPVALDSHLDTWTNFDNRYWPAHYLINRSGQVVYTHFGEGEYDVTENNIRYLLGLPSASQAGAAPAGAEQPAFSPEQTPETYLGYFRSRGYAGAPRVARDAALAYRFPDALPADSWALSGNWTVGGERIVAAAPGAALRLHFRARKVFLVMGMADGRPVHATITLNGKPPGEDAGADAPGGALTVGRDTLYELIDQKQFADGVVEIRAAEPGLRVYAFTFGS